MRGVRESERGEIDREREIERVKKKKKKNIFI